MSLVKVPVDLLADSTLYSVGANIYLKTMAALPFDGHMEQLFSMNSILLLSEMVKHITWLICSRLFCMAYVVLCVHKEHIQKQLIAAICWCFIECVSAGHWILAPGNIFFNAEIYKFKNRIDPLFSHFYRFKLHLATSLVNHIDSIINVWGNLWVLEQSH